MIVERKVLNRVKLRLELGVFKLQSQVDAINNEIEQLLAQPEQEQKPLSEDAVDKCLANAIKDGWYPVNEDSYRQGFWDAVKFLEVGNESI